LQRRRFSPCCHSGLEAPHHVLPPPDFWPLDPLDPQQTLCCLSRLDSTPLLPNKVSLWGLKLVTQFIDALSPGLQEVLQTNPACSPPNLSTLTCGLSQLPALCALCIAAVCQFSLIRAQERLISKTVLCQMNRQSPSTAAVAAPFYPAAASCPASFTLTCPDDVSFQAHSFMPPVEQTMRRYQPASSQFRLWRLPR
jgi:hypothetical protein